MNSEGHPPKYPPRWSSRLLAVLAYCCGAPITALVLRRRDDPYLRHHHAQGLCVWAVLHGVLLLYVAVSLGISYILVYHRGWYEDTPLEPTLLMIVRRAFLCWLVVWAFSVFWALRGSWAPVPFVGRLARWKPVRRGSLAMCTVLLAAAVLVAGLTVHAKTLTRPGGPPAEAYLLFDDMGAVPHWVFDLGFYPIARAATDKWGPDSVVVTPLTKERLADAFVHGRFVFVLSHGTEAGLYTRDFRIKPAEAAPEGVGNDLQLVYITGCDSGVREREWKATLAPANVITFDRLSAWLEHIYWLLFRGAGMVRELE